MYDARQVANFLLDAGDREGIALTHLSLQKIVYFSHGLSYARFGEPLISNKIEAWKNGPVVRELYFAFSNSGDRRIATRAKMLSFETRREEPIAYDFPDRVASHLTDTLHIYGPIPAWKLVSMTHEVGTPWEVTVAKAENHANVGMHIDEALIRGFFVGSAKK
jgi:uncharacterized phage-associated protein